MEQRGDGDRGPSRVVVHADALAWMRVNEAPARASVVTSLPDVSELPELGFDGWRRWFVDTARTILRWLPEEGACVFFQSDVRHGGALVDKGYLILRAAEDEGATVPFHKVVCRKPPGTVSVGRPSWSHLIAVSRVARRPPLHAGPDVLPDAGFMPWSRAMGVEACRVACGYLRDDVGAAVVVDPFCGRGTVLAVANAMGLDAIGIELSARRCRRARSLALDVPR
jgi:hypothetical protein